MLQTFPGVVFLCDQTELAVERAVADAIIVRPTGDAIMTSVAASGVLGNDEGLQPDLPALPRRAAAARSGRPS